MSSEAGSSPTTGSEDVRGRGAASARVGMFAPFDLLERGPEAARAADDVAEFLAPYAAAGCTEFNLIPQSPDHDVSIAGAAAVKGLLA
jgi:hypothetical protein